MAFQTQKADWAFVISATSVFVFALILTAWDFIYVQKATLQLGAVNALGLILFCAGVVLRVVARVTLGRHYSYGLRILPNHKLITHGVYRHVRHPISLALLIYSPAIPLIFGSFYGFLVMLGLVPLILYRIRIEERMLIEKFGDVYRGYMKKTKRLIPFIY